MGSRTEERRREIFAALQAKGATGPCPRCGESRWEVLDDALRPSTTPRLRETIPPGGVEIPTAILACSRCGFLARHALGALGVSPSEGAPAPPLTVLSATYGAEGKVIDLTDTLANVAVVGRVDVKVGNHLGGGPHPGVVKHIQVTFLHFGKRQVKTAREGETLSLP